MRIAQRAQQHIGLLDRGPAIGDVEREHLVVLDPVGKGNDGVR
jgi:hypothetical protein